VNCAGNGETHASASAAVSSVCFENGPMLMTYQEPATLVPCGARADAPTQRWRVRPVTQRRVIFRR